MTYDTLSYNGVEQPLAAWYGITSCVLERGNLREDTLTITTGQTQVTDNPVFPFEAPVAVYSGRASATGAANSFSGGVCKFQGKRVRWVAKVTAEHGHTYTFEGPSYDLQQTPYQQSYQGVLQKWYPGEVVLGTSNQNPGGILYFPISVGDQLQSALQWLLDQYAAQGMAAPYQYKGRALHSGAIDITRTQGTPNTGPYDAMGFAYSYAVPTDGSATIDPALFKLYLPTFVAKSINCFDVLKQWLAMSPRTSVGFDYATIPPTIHVQSVDNFPAASLPIMDGVSHKTLNIERMDKLQARAVVITYRINNKVGSATEIDYAWDKWGAQAGGTEGPNPLVTTGLRVLLDTVDLSGVQATIVKGHLDCEPLGCVGGSTYSKRAWWSSRRGGEQAKLIDSRYRFQLRTISGSTVSASAKSIPDAVLTYSQAGFDVTGAAVAAGQQLTSADLAFYQYRLVHGTHHSWMTTFGTPVLSLKVRVTARAVQFAEYDAVSSGDTKGQLPANESTTDADTSGNIVADHGNGQDLHVDIDLTNGPSGDYSTYSSITPGEGYIIGAGGIAQYLYDALKVLQYDGETVKVEADFGAGVSVVNCLNLTGGRVEWTTMNAQVQLVTEDFITHETRVKIGVAKHLSAAQLTSLLNMWRWRRLWYNPAVRSDNTGAATGEAVDMPQKAGGANATTGADPTAGIVCTFYNTPGDPTSGVAGSIDTNANWMNGS